MQNGGDGFQLLLVVSQFAIIQCNGLFLTRCHALGALDVPLRWEEYASGVILVNQGMMHSTERKTIQFEPNIEFCTFVGTERVTEGEDDLVQLDCMDSAFEPLPGLQVRAVGVTDKDVIADQYRWPVLR